MAQDTMTEDDVLYIRDRESPIRYKIMKHLSSLQDYVSISDLEESTGESKGNVNYHCDKLEGRGLVDIKKPVRKKLVKITEKGLQAWHEIERRGKSNQGKRS